MKISKIITLLIVTLIASFILTGCATPVSDTNVYLVRHAEKVVAPDVGPDPDLTDQGKARAELLADILSDKSITHIHSSDYIRTRDTAKPLAEALALEVEIYDPKNLEGLAAKIENARGSHLVVGHSNTIPETVVALSGDGGTEIDEKSEYDRLYKVVISNDGKVKTTLTRFGDKYAPLEK